MVVSEMKLSRCEREYLWDEVIREISLNNLITFRGSDMETIKPVGLYRGEAG